MITLYHGSNVTIDTIKLDKCSPNKDFGRGFYLTDIEEQAIQMASRRVRISGKGEPVVSAYIFDENLLDDAGLRVKIFVRGVKRNAINRVVWKNSNSFDK